MKTILICAFVSISFTLSAQIQNIVNDPTQSSKSTLDCLSFTKPMFVLDNKIIPCDSVRTIEPNDIEEIQVLKGASAEAIYGPNGSRNGTVVIITKNYAALRKREKEAAEIEKP